MLLEPFVEVQMSWEPTTVKQLKQFRHGKTVGIYLFEKATGGEVNWK